MTASFEEHLIEAHHFLVSLSQLRLAWRCSDNVI
jgi:hypothetical protein